MTNPLKGEVSLDVKVERAAAERPELARFDGKRFTLRYTSDALARIENELDRGILEIGIEMMGWSKDPKRVRFGFVRAALWGALQDKHPDIDLVAAGDLVVAAGGMMAVLPHITEALTNAFPQPETNAAPQAETKGARPPNRAERRRKKAGTG